MTQDVIETLAEKFRPDMRMLSSPKYSLYEVHVSGGQCGQPGLVGASSSRSVWAAGAGGGVLISDVLISSCKGLQGHASGF